MKSKIILKKFHKLHTAQEFVNNFDKNIIKKEFVPFSLGGKEERIIYFFIIEYLEN
ncbi:MAG: hypothetical protein OQK82_09010 [Candidatus Pacearchaeota archaeon]|nr:hypothetical protein [Candidatus Pacearchaeota archaeon]